MRGGAVCSAMSEARSGRISGPGESDARPLIQDEEAGARPRVWEVAALVHAVADALSSRFPSLAVRGELAGYGRAPSGHSYFSLKDADGAAALRCAMFRRAAALLDFEPRDGDLVEVRGRLAVYEPRGELQFVVESMRHAGAGALYERFLRVKAQLTAQGLFDAVRKRPITAFPRGIGIVTSLSAAALHDVVSALQRRAPHVPLVIFPSPVQGAEAPVALVEAIAAAGRCAAIDTLLVCRGGGSLEDLWAFNDPAVVRAIVACRVPVIVGVGHETDVTLADFAADLRAPTPTAAAELAALPQDVALMELRAQGARVQRSIAQTLDAQGQRLDHVALRLARPLRGLAPLRQRLALLQARLSGLPQAHLGRQRGQVQGLDLRLAQGLRREGERHRRRTELLAARLEALDPSKVLARGYAWLTDDSGHMLVSVNQLEVGRALEAQLADGRARARITAVEPGEPAKKAVERARRTRRKPPP
jgi:exodeoxyribonuclease VII large subunit